MPSCGLLYVLDDSDAEMQRCKEPESERRTPVYIVIKIRDVSERFECAK